MESFGGFVWPRSGKVTCLNWSPEPKCGRGLHGLLWGEGGGNLLNVELENRIWLVLEVDSESIVDLGGKVKFPECEVIYAGNKEEAIEKILERNPGAACAYAQKNVGNNGVAIVGDYGQATAGDGGQATAGNFGQATAGNFGQATAGDYGEATAGNDGEAIAGYYGVATAGYGGQAIAGHGGQAQAGLNGIIEIGYFDGKRERKLIGYVGENGIKANVMYKVVNDKFEKQNSKGVIYNERV